MELLSKKIVSLFFSFLLISCSSPSDSSENELQAGEFKAQTTGAIENEFSGNASFSIDSLEGHQHPYLILSLDAGKVPFAPDSVIGGNYGIFLAAPWDSSTTVSIENSMLINLYVVPNSFERFHLSTGSIFIDDHSPAILTGEISLEKTLDNSSKIEIKGKFKASQFE